MRSFIESVTDQIYWDVFSRRNTVIHSRSVNDYSRQFHFRHNFISILNLFYYFFYCPLIKGINIDKYIQKQSLIAPFT